ncbi:3-deoxy-D-manno-octulosonic acid transferase [Desulfobulbus alkaliphilus]|uniref:3-deoxy-D-manno-octulosonic acid transferase n=1 Tax=Desulfobulbus alkaliphilus TaxID=869814 RepID=UPI0019645BB7|nr:glycosyltransferase N-terminal domain-containing protein [Desulfobulbus alkaliphilus]MBM9536952.1 3-deoxy-D-manno-octulosonic acid transferase [Desulfobulbus alkaliphilus]
MELWTTEPGKEGPLLYLLYSTLGRGVYLSLQLFRPLLERIGGRYAYGLAERLGRYACCPSDGSTHRQIIWIHASSVGEVQAALLLADALQRTENEPQLVCTSATEQGNKLAKSRMPARVPCLMAPLDVPQAVQRALRALRPDLYICLETELWPALLTALRQAKVPMLLLNGRMSQRSLRRYLWIRSSMTSLVSGFAAVAVISEADGRRYTALGLPESRLRVCGNMKYDMQAENPQQVRLHSRRLLGVTGEKVFLCGSTHQGEEELLLPVFLQLGQRCDTVWVLAPRHLERLPALEAFLHRSGMPFAYFSRLANGKQRPSVVVIDTMGDLADLYAGGDYIFCGGSLVDRGGHNVMEAARWGRPVYFGPYMKDFRDAAELLIAAGGGFQVSDADHLADLLLAHLDAPDHYAATCARAADIAGRQRGAVRKQVALVHEVLEASTDKS